MYNVELTDNGNFEIYDGYQYICTVSSEWDLKLKIFFNEDDLSEIRAQILLADSMKYIKGDSSASNTNTNSSFNNSSDPDIDFITFIILGIVFFIIATFIYGLIIFG